MAERPSMRDRVREQAQKSTTEGASYLKLAKKVKFFQPKDGEEYDIDILPFENDKSNHPKGYTKGELIPYVRFQVHKNIGAEDSAYVCPRTILKKCPICEERERMRKSSNSDADVIKALAPKDRMLFQLIDVSPKSADDILLWDHSYHGFGKRLLGDIDRAENATGKKKKALAHAGFAELEDGQTLTITVEESKKFKGFMDITRIDACDRDPYNEDILDDVLNLDDCLKILDYDALEAIFLEMDPEDQGSRRSNKDEDKEEKGSGRSRGRGKKEEKEEEESPSRSRRGAAKEEEEEPPARSRRGRGESEEKEEEPPARSRRGSTKEEDKEEEPPPRSRRGAATEKEEEPPARSRRGAKEEEPPARSRRGTSTEDSPKCPVGGKFGVDCDTHVDKPGCYECPDDTWKACKAAQQA